MTNKVDPRKSLNESLKSVALRISELESKIDRKEATEADWTAYTGLVNEGQTIRTQLDKVEAAAALKSWMEGPDGDSAFRKSISQESTTPEDREQEQNAQEGAIKSAYKGAFESYLVHGSKVGPADKKILEEGAIKAGPAMKVLVEYQAQGGGYMVPEQFQAEVLKKTPGLIGLNDSVRSQPTNRDVVVWPIVRYSTSNTYTAPHRLTWTGEIPATAASARVTDQTFGEVRIPVNLAMASQLLSNSLIEDSATDVMQLTASLFRENILQDVEFYLCQGTGAGQPEGLFVNGLLRANANTSGMAASTTSGGIMLQYWNTPAQYRANAKWLFNSPTAMIVASIVDGNGRYMWQASDMFGGGLGSVQQDGAIVTQPRLLGCPVVISEQCPSPAANQFFSAFGDLHGYIKAERVGMTVRVLDELYAETDQKLYLLRYRFGGQVAEDYKIRLLKAAV
jgi:HK97 family phage major capsid protein